MEFFYRASAVLEKIRNPLSLAGLILLIVVFTINKILSLTIFANVGASGTVTLLTLIIKYTYWLGFVAVGTGCLSYVIDQFSKRRKPNLELLDARIDPSLTSQNTQKVKNDCRD